MSSRFYDMIRILTLTLGVAVNFGPVLVMAGPTSQSPIGEDLVLLPSLDSIYLRKVKDLWEVGIVNKNGERFSLRQADQILSVTEFAQGPKPSSTKPWHSIQIKENGSLKDVKTWFMYGSEQGYHFIRRSNHPENPYFLFSFPGPGTVPKSVSSSQIIIDRTGYFLFSIEESNGRGWTIIVNSLGNARLVAQRFIQLERGDEKLFSVANGYLSFAADNSIQIKMPFEDGFPATIDAMTKIETNRPVSGVGANISKIAGEVAQQLTNFVGFGENQPPTASTQPVVQPENLQTPKPSPAPAGAMQLPTVGGQAKAPVQATVLPKAPITFQYADQTFSIYFVAPGKEDSGTFLKRESDQKIVKISPKVVPTTAVGGSPETSIQVEDGILSHPELPRKIDLDRFEVEMRFVPTRDDGDFKWLSENFGDVRADGDRRIKPAKVRAELVKETAGRLSAAGKASAILTGEAGDMEFVMREAMNLLPRTWSIQRLDAGSVGADIGTVGAMQNVAKKLENLSRSAPIVWFAEDFEGLDAVGKMTADGPGFLTEIRSFVRKGIMRVAGLGGPDFHSVVKDSQLLEGLKVTEIDPLSESDVIETVVEWMKSNPGSPMGSESFIRAAMDTAADFKPEMGDPERTLSLLEDIYAVLLSENRLSLENLVPAEVDKAAQRLYRMDPAMRNLNVQRLRLENLLPKFRESIIGHGHIQTEIYEGTKISLAGLNDRRGPRNSFFIDGPPGIGKTEIAIAYANVMGLPYVRIEMNQFKGGKLGKDVLLKQIAEALKKNPFTVIILDEIEKADTEVLEGLLAMMDNERFTYYEDSGAGTKKPKKGSAVNATVFMTSNAVGDIATEFFKNLIEEEKLKGNDLRDIKFTGQHLMDEFLKIYPIDVLQEIIVAKGIPKPLFDRVKVFSVGFPPNFSGLKRILALKLKSAVKNINKKMKIEAVFENADQWLETLAEKSMNEGWSTRRVIAAALKEINSRASDLILSQDFQAARSYKIDFSIPRACSNLADGD